MCVQTRQQKKLDKGVFTKDRNTRVNARHKIM